MSGPASCIWFNHARKSIHHRTSGRHRVRSASIARSGTLTQDACTVPDGALVITTRIATGCIVAAARTLH